MKMIEFEGQTLLLGAPKGWDQKGGVQCGYLPVQVFEEGDHTIMRSIWKLDEAELEHIAKTGYVVLDVIGRTHPPVRLAVAVSGVVELP